jgi:hypothetical protein
MAETLLLRYRPGTDWERVLVRLDSPRPDGSVAYYSDSLCPHYPSGRLPFDDQIARALCQHLMLSVASRQLEITDGPYLQVLPDGDTVPGGFVIVRALTWVEEFDLLVPTDTGQAVSGP